MADTVNLQEVLDFAKEWARIGGERLQLYYAGGQFSDLTIEPGPKGIVTAADVLNDRYLRDEITATYPSHGIISEEELPVKGGEYTWIVDPCDGTNNFSRGLPFYSVSIGLRKNSKGQVGVVSLPVLDEMYYAARGHGAFREYTDNQNIRRVERLHVSGPESIDMFNFSFSTAVDFIEPEKQDRFISEIRESGLFRSMRRRMFESVAYELCLVARGAFDAHYNNYANSWDIAAGEVIVSEAGGQFTHLRPYGNPYGNVLASNGVRHEQLVRLYNRTMKR